MQHKEGGKIHADLTFNSNQAEQNAVLITASLNSLLKELAFPDLVKKTISGMHFCYLSCDLSDAFKQKFICQLILPKCYQSLQVKNRLEQNSTDCTFSVSLWTYIFSECCNTSSKVHSTDQNNQWQKLLQSTSISFMTCGHNWKLLEFYPWHQRHFDNVKMKRKWTHNTMIANNRRRFIVFQRFKALYNLIKE